LIGYKKFIGSLQVGVSIGLFWRFRCGGHSSLAVQLAWASRFAECDHAVRQLFEHGAEQGRSQTRLDIARDIYEVIAQNRNVRFGLFGFQRYSSRLRYGHDAREALLLVEVGIISTNTPAGVSHFNMLNASLDAINPGASPLLPTPHWPKHYYEVTSTRTAGVYPPVISRKGKATAIQSAQYRHQRNAGLI
jgi:hypothetical protein